MTVEETTAEIPRPSLVTYMLVHPGRIAYLVAEWLAIGVLVVLALAAVFLVAVGCYSLVTVTPK